MREPGETPGRLASPSRRMRLYIEHHTYFRYDHLVREQTGEARLQPRDGDGQRLVGGRVVIDPATPVSLISDRFGNAVHCYSVLPWHKTLTVTATSLIETSDSPLIPAPPLSPLAQHDFLSPSRYAPQTWELAQFAREHSQDDGDEARALAIMAAIYTTCEYVPGSTDISTTADAVLSGRQGVCQDFAHLMLALCRAERLPARYISGYLYDPAKPQDAVLASHAWVEVFVTGQGWLGLDPTHNRPTDAHYVRVAVGRDYADATPVRGFYKGMATEQLDVQVFIRRVDEWLTVGRGGGVST